MTAKYREVISVQGSQTSKTDGLLLNTLGWKMDTDPKPVLFFSPTERNAKAISHRISQMIKSVPRLAASLDEQRDNLFEKFFNGARFGMGWGGSKTEVASHPAALVLYDELGDVSDIPGQGNPYQLTKVRGATFPDFTQVGCGSPAGGQIEDEVNQKTYLIHWAWSDNVSSLIWQLWQEGTRHEFMLECPDCHTYFAPKSKLLWWPEKAKNNEIETKTCLRCPHCSVLIEQKHQHKMIRNGKPIAPGQLVKNGEIIGEPPATKIYSMHVNGLCSIWVKWGQRAVEYARVLASKNNGRIQAAMNTEFGECYFQEETLLDWEGLQKYREKWKMGDVPAEVKVLTCFVDVQENRLVLTICGWAHDDDMLECYVILHQEIHGMTAHPQVWQDLENVLKGQFGAQKMTIRETGIDSGYNPSRSKSAKLSSIDAGINRNVIYEFARKHQRVTLTKGSSRPLTRPYTRTIVDVTPFGKLHKAGLTAWLLDTDYFKAEVMAKLSWGLDKPGRWHFPSDLPDEFMREVTSEYKDLETGKWITTRDNHALDCVVGNLFIAQKMGLSKRIPSKGKNLPPTTNKNEEEQHSGTQGKARARTTKQKWIQKTDWI